MKGPIDQMNTYLIKKLPFEFIRSLVLTHDGSLLYTNIALERTSRNLWEVEIETRSDASQFMCHLEPGHEPISFSKYRTPPRWTTAMLLWWRIQTFYFRYLDKR